MKPLVLLALNCGWVVHAAVIGLITGIEQCAPDAVGIGACDTLLSLQSNVTRAAARLFSSAALQVGVSVPASWSTVVHRGRSLAEHLMLAADHVMITDQAEVTCGPTTLLGCAAVSAASAIGPFVAQAMLLRARGRVVSLSAGVGLNNSGVPRENPRQLLLSPADRIWDPVPISAAHAASSSWAWPRIGWSDLEPFLELAAAAVGGCGPGSSGICRPDQQPFKEFVLVDADGAVSDQPGSHPAGSHPAGSHPAGSQLTGSPARGMTLDSGRLAAHLRDPARILTFCVALRVETIYVRLDRPTALLGSRADRAQLADFVKR